MSPSDHPSSGVPPLPGPAAAPAVDERYRCGTLQYTKFSLFVVFTWLLWGDLCYTLFESAGGPGILTLYLQENFHVSNLQIYVLFVLIPNLIGVVMTSVISFKSDRTRSRWGRRIPYMALTAPFLCFFAAAIGFSDEIIDFFKTNLTQDSFVTPFTMAMMVIGFLAIGFAFFNEFVGTVYWYLFADVVPHHFLGRFMGLFRLIGFVGGLLTSWFIVPYQLTHMKAIHVGIALLYLVGFSLMCWRVKEGQYPPVTDVVGKTPFLTQVKLYFKQSFTHPIFIMLYLMTGTTMLTRGCSPAGVFGLHVNQHQSAVAAHSAGSGCLSSTPDGKRWASAGSDGLVKLWDGTNPKQFRLLQTLSAPGGAIPSVSISPDGKTVAAGSAVGAIRIWDAAGARVGQDLTGHQGPVQCLAISRDGRRLASGGADGTVRIWDIPAGTCAKRLTGHQGTVYSVAFSCDGGRVVSGGADRKIIVRDIDKTASALTLEGSPGPVYAVCFAPALAPVPQKARTALEQPYMVVANYFRDVFTNESLYDTPADTKSKVLCEDGWVISGGQDGGTDEKNAIVRVWDITGDQAATKPNGKQPNPPIRELRGHKKAITSLAYKPDIRMVLSGSKDSVLRIWDPVKVSDLAGDQSYMTYSGYTLGVTSLACQANGTMAANLSDDGSLHLWNLDRGISLYKNGMSGVFFNIIAALLAYPFGALVDRMHPLRVTLWTTALVLPFTFASYWLFEDYTSSFWLNIVKMPFTGLAGAASIPLLVVLLPKVKYGQMCSANALVKQAVAVIAGFLGAILMDWLTSKSLNTDGFRYGFLFQGLAGVLTVATLLGVYRYWKRLGADKYVAPET